MPGPGGQHSTDIERADIAELALGNVEIIQRPKLKPLEEPVVKYTIPPDIDVIGVNTPRYDCCVQKVIDEMGLYIREYGMQFVVGQDEAPRDIINYFPKHVLYFRSGTIPGTHPTQIQLLDAQIQYFHSLGMKVHYYLDDNLLGINNRAPIQLMQNCDGIIVSTNCLRDAILAEGIQRPIYVLRTHVALNMFGMLTPIPDLTSPNRLNVLFSSQGRIGVRQIVRLLEKLDEKAELGGKFHLFCLSHEVAQIRSVINKFRSIKKTYLEWLPLDMYYRLCSSMDVIVAPGEVGDLDYMMPREAQQPWLDAKSCHKYTVAGAASIPCISSPLRDYVEAIEHGKTGFIAETDKQWVDYITLLADDPDFRKEMGAEAKKDIEKNWSLYDRTREMTEIFKGEAKPCNQQTAVEVRSELSENPSVLVYIPVHNYHQYIRECLDSVVSQSYANQEVIVCDNASDDGTREIVETEYPQVKLIKYDTFQKYNLGITEAVKMSNCKFVINMGADDKLSPNFWETALPFFTSSDIGFVRIGTYTFSENNPDGVWEKPLPFNNPKELLALNKVIVSSPMRREAFEGVTLDPEALFSDWDMWLQMVLVKGWKWATCRKPLLWYRIHEGSASRDTTNVEAYAYMRDKWMPYLLKYGIKGSTMATPQEIEEAKKNSKYALEEITENAPPLAIPPPVKSSIHPKVLAFVPAYNASKYLRECLDSLVAQKYPNQVIMIGDNCSTDDTLDIVKKEYPMVKIVTTLQHDPKLNPLTNAAFMESDCDYMVSLGADDRLSPDYWETLLPYFDSPEIGFVRIGAMQFNEVSNPNGTYWKPFAWHNPLEIFEGNKVFWSSPIRHTMFVDLNGIDLRLIWGDWDFWMRGVLKGWKWKTCEKPMYWYRRHDKQESFSKATYSDEESKLFKEKWMPIFKRYGVKRSMIASEKELNE